MLYGNTINESACMRVPKGKGSYMSSMCIPDQHILCISKKTQFFFFQWTLRVGCLYEQQLIEMHSSSAAFADISPATLVIA